MTTLLLLLSSALSAATVSHRAVARQVPEELRLLAGCFEVRYHYKEDGREPYEIKALEWVELVEEKDAVLLQHYGIDGDDVMKHWGERWTIGPDGYRQEVLSPSGKKRYACDGPFVAALGRGGCVYRRRCEAKGAPKPQRDAKREDYETLDRVSELNVTNKGWSDAQTNTKRDAQGNEISKEIGLNEYKRVDDARCAKAKERK